MHALTGVARVVAVGLLLLETGCYRYVPVTTNSPSVGEEFRAHLTEEGSTRLAPMLGAQVATVEGRVSSTNDTGYVVSVSTTTNRARVPTFWTGESVTIPRTTIQTLEARRLDRKRTWLVASVGIVGGFLMAQIFGLFDGSAGGDGPGPPPPPPP
ncbi:MAG TPA: hypothetical protein VJ717_12580 [Gemmatimonadaceae bacterium]|nr:hypothetical protein [Gemmatimonadaceae bacterium]